MRPEAVEAMLPFLTERFANPSGAHRAARDARRALDDARDALADVLGVQPGEIVFTGGGTEADNLAIFGVCAAAGGIAVTSAAEHHAVLHAVEQAGGRICPVDRAGHIDLDRLADLLDPTVAVVSVMLVNNEVGTVTDLEAVAAVVAERAPQAVLHTDAVQALTWLDLRVAAAPAQLISISAHKFGGPKGSGVLAVRNGVSLRAQLVGGGQERERRSGTQNVGGAVATAVAATAADRTRPDTAARLAGLRQRLVGGLRTAVPGLRETVQELTSPRRGPVAGIAHLCVPGTESEALLFLAEQQGVYAAAGSSCASGATQLSHVLAAMGVDAEEGRGALRLSLGWASTVADVERALEVLPAAAAQLRRRVA
jgi:cysteine desulfurase